MNLKSTALASVAALALTATAAHAAPIGNSFEPTPSFSNNSQQSHPAPMPVAQKLRAPGIVKVGPKGGKKHTMSVSKFRAKHPSAYRLLKKAERTAQKLQANPSGPVPLTCHRFPFFISCVHGVWWCAVGWSGGELKFNCGRNDN